jgi:hypothetical protein
MGRESERSSARVTGRGKRTGELVVGKTPKSGHEKEKKEHQTASE